MDSYPLGFPGDDLMVVCRASSLERAIKKFKKSFGVEPEMVTETGDALAERMERSYYPWQQIRHTREAVRLDDYERRLST